MKSLEELAAIREAARADMGVRNERHAGMRVVVGMATCGIAAGARPVLSALVEAVAGERLDVQVGQSGCMGLCQYEPVVEVYAPGGAKTTYVRMTAAKAAEVVHRHLKEGRVVEEYTIGAAGK